MFTRRHFFFGSLLSGAVPIGGYASTPSLKALGYKSPNERINLAAIGAGGQPGSDLRIAQAGVENVVALADCDWDRGQEGFKRYPDAAKYKDYRQMLQKSGRDIDAVVVGPPDHMHAAAALSCMQAGKHVYLEKPLTRTAWEARLLTDAAAKYPVATQMGNQGYSHDATRGAAEIIWSGEIGDVTEVHAWTGTPSWPQGMRTIPPPTPVPATLDWDLWLGVAAVRPFTAGDQDYWDFVATRSGRRERDFGFYLPFNWRGFYDFGSSLIGDWGVHILGPANWALQLGPESLVSVECVRKDSLPPFTFPDELTIRYEFAARRGMPPVTVYWYQHQGGDPYTPPGMTAAQARKIAGTGPQVGPASPRRTTQPATPQAPSNRSGYNCIFVGSKGYLGTNGRGEGVGLLPGSRWAEYRLPQPYLTRSPGASTGSNHAAHCRDWIRACKGGAPACSHFGIAGPYTEWLVLGAAAVHYDGKLMWNNSKGEFSNNRDAARWVKPALRKGWEIRL
jgi:predicted dehydrogenase